MKALGDFTGAYVNVCVCVLEINLGVFTDRTWRESKQNNILEQRLSIHNRWVMGKK